MSNLAGVAPADLYCIWCNINDLHAYFEPQFCIFFFFLAKVEKGPQPHLFPTYNNIGGRS